MTMLADNPTQVQPTCGMRQVMQMLGITMRVLRRLEDEGVIRGVPQGTGTVYRVADIEAMLDQRRPYPDSCAMLPGRLCLVTYFMQAGADGPVKIGMSNNLRLRFKSLQTDCPFRVRCLGVLDGDREEEMHERFSAFRMLGEWFRPQPELIEFIAAHTRRFDR